MDKIRVLSTDSYSNFKCYENRDCSVTSDRHSIVFGVVFHIGLCRRRVVYVWGKAKITSIAIMRNRILLQLGLLLGANWMCTVDGFAVVSKAHTKTVPFTRSSRTVTTSLLQATAPDDDDSDDGWGDNSKMKELQALQQERVESATSSSRRETTNSNNASSEQERDLFIPIFAVVSLAGLFGAYGYEMLRLYSRGELYLPF